jgi:hypothetical protein
MAFHPLKEEKKYIDILTVFGNMVLKRLFRTKKGEIAEGCRKLNDKLHNLFFHQIFMR